MTSPPVIPGQATWRTLTEALQIACRRATLRRTLPIALAVGTILSLINQVQVVSAGDANLATWGRVAANYVVPLFVSTIGFLSACRRPLA
ncbi:MAG TPA: nitrate/nitrite transporter NrtS [Acidimicrobiia bacterium]|nr:nitrate/nitrite transporter NrtS [Acidimicrobiia bacterium]